MKGVSCTECSYVYTNPTKKTVASHWRWAHFDKFPSDIMFNCYCKACRMFLHQHKKVQEGHYCMDHQPEGPPTLDTLASTVRSMVEAEKEKAKQQPFTREQLLFRLRELESQTKDYDPERDHGIADDLLIKYIDDKEIKLAYDHVKKYYA